MAKPSLPVNRFINRELSWLEFNQRVLDEARDESLPLLERLKFLAITASNLDEFFMVRVGSLQQLQAAQPSKRCPAAMTAGEQLNAISLRTHQMLADQYDCFNNELEPALAAAGIHRVRPQELTERQAKVLERLFEEEIVSIYAPVGISLEHEFPQLANQTLNVLVRVLKKENEEETVRHVLIPFGGFYNRFVALPSEGGYAYILLEDVVALFAQRFFPEEEILECAPFRITRSADMSVSEDQAADLLAGMEEILDARKESRCVRLELTGASPAGQAFLQHALNVADDHVFSAPGPLDLGSFMQMAFVSGFDSLRYEDWPPQHSVAVDRSRNMFDVVAEKDILLIHPYESFEPVVRMIEEAAVDPDVLAIKQILYRTSRNSTIVAALRRAAEKGKRVTVIVELKARFDEARNIEWAKDLEKASVQVVYGVKGLKTHAKVCIIVRREPQGIVRYVHFGTGNYNESTARLYSDVSYLTANEELGADAVSFFNAITGYTQPSQLTKLDSAPLSLREKLMEMIEAEITFKKQGQKAEIAAKLNSLVDEKVIDALYSASQAGVKVRLNIRGICCLRPGVEGLSDNIEVVSIIDRYLEHARAFYFYHGGDERVFISSADWMPRNLDRRVELLIPIEELHCRTAVIDMLDAYFRDNVKASELRADGSYRRNTRGSRKKPFRSQEHLYKAALKRIRLVEQSHPTAFEPHRASEDD